jgi:hypothetical protein
MRRLTLFGAIAAAVVALGAPTAAGHNAGCVLTGNGTWVFVGSGNEAPFVPEQNPKQNELGGPGDLGRLDLQPQSTGDQYGARFAVTKGSAVQHPSNCPATR